MNKSELKALAEEAIEASTESYWHQYHEVQKLAQGVLDILEENQKLKRDHKLMRDALDLIRQENIYVGENGWKDEYFLSVKQANEALSQLEIKDE